MKALSLDLRERILTAVLEVNESMPKIAARFSVSHKMVQKLKYQCCDPGDPEVSDSQGRSKSTHDGQAV